VISYAQNYEDVVLERCFADVAAGFYIDVGAWDPFEHSVTHYFYERGWHGINIEPNPEYFERLERDRTRDTNLRVALGEADRESQTFTILKGSGISTLRSLSDDYLENLDGRGYPQEPTEVSTVTLASVCRDHVPEGTEIEFLKIDVEGWETQVLRGHDWDRWRPKVLVIEAVTPVGFDEASGRDVYADSSSEWEPIVLGHGYVFGLNEVSTASTSVRRVPNSSSTCGCPPTAWTMPRSTPRGRGGTSWSPPRRRSGRRPSHSTRSVGRSSRAATRWSDCTWSSPG
jgi:FkbM family methyltransferase